MTQGRNYTEEIKKIKTEIEKMNLDYSLIRTILISLSDKSKALLNPLIGALLLKKYDIYATGGTKNFLEDNGLIDINLVFKISESGKSPNFEELINDKKIDLIINISSPAGNGPETTDGEKIRSLAAQTKTLIITNDYMAVHLLLDLINR